VVICSASESKRKVWRVSTSMLTMTIEEFIRIWSSRTLFTIRVVSGDSKIFRGDGTVKTSKPDCRTVISEERGVWRSLDDSNRTFRNVYLWSFQGENLNFDLAHLRYGRDRPVHLVDFIAIAEDAWQSVSPHVCGADLYNARMNYSGSELKLSWSIRGPTKSQQVDYTYY
jgi:hypothetical protein